MKKIYIYLALAICLLPAISTKATNYYFSTLTGDDNRSNLEAQSPETPWKSITKLNSFSTSLKPGDSILFCRGESFTGSIKLQKSGTAALPIVIAAYGSPFKGIPVISGLADLSGWVDNGGGIWSSNCTSCGTYVNTLVMNGVQKEMGRYPNSDAANRGYLTFEAHTGNTQITDNELTSATNWTGGELVIRPYRWVHDRNLITNHSGSVITFSIVAPASGYEPNNKFGYFIQNHKSTLDKEGEWYYEASTKKIYVFMGAKNPTSSSIQASTVDNLVNITNQSYFVIRNITFTGSNQDAIKLSTAQSVKIQNCSILYAGINGITASNTKDVVVENNTINGSNSTAVHFNSGCNNTTIRSNTIKNSGMMIGMCKSGNNTSEGILMYGDNSTIEYNTIDSTGYIGIFFSGNNVLIKNNYLNYFAVNKDDGGGIYTYVGASKTVTWSNRKIVGNIILNGVGASEGSNDPNHHAAEGIYMDDNTGEVDIIDNTVANCSNQGIYLHNSHNINVIGNTVYNNSTELAMQHDNLCTNCLMRNNNMSKNVFFAKVPEQYVATYESIKPDISLFGKQDSNYYCRPFDDQFAINTSYADSGKTFASLQDLNSWQANFLQDKYTQKSPVLLPLYNITGFNGSNKFGNGSFTSNVQGISTYASTGNISATWDNSSKMDGPCLKYLYTCAQPNISLINISVGALTAGKKYIFKFSLLGENTNRIINAYLMQKPSPYARLTPKTSIKVTNSRTEQEIMFSSNTNETAVYLVLEVNEKVGTLWLDNIQFYEANVTINNPDDYIRFEYNASTTPKTVYLENSYKDAKNNYYSGSLSIPSFSSVILMKTGTVITNVKLPIEETEKAELELNVYPNPAKGKFFIANDEIAEGKSVLVVLYNTMGVEVYSKVLIKDGAVAIDTEDRIAPGIYVVMATSDDRLYKKKLIITQ